MFDPKLLVTRDSSKLSAAWKFLLKKPFYLLHRFITITQHGLVDLGTHRQTNKQTGWVTMCVSGQSSQVRLRGGATQDV